MSAHGDATIVSTVASILEEAVARRLKPTAVRGELRRAAPGRSIELVEEELAATGSYDYQAIVPRAEGGAFGVSVSLPEALPWPLRGARRWSERDVLRVNNTVLQVADVIQSLDGHLRVGELVEHLVNACLIQEGLATRTIEVSTEQKQEALDRFRRTRGLHSAEATWRWMKERGYTKEALERLAAADAEVRALRRLVVGDQVDAFCQEHGSELATVEVIRIMCKASVDLEEVRTALAGSATKWVEWLRRVRGSTIWARMRRWELREAIPVADERALTAGQTWAVGPAATEGCSQFLHVLCLTPGVLDPHLREDVEAHLFRRWLAEQRSRARIEWYWGTTDGLGGGGGE